MTVSTSRKESLLTGSHTTTPEQQRKAGLTVARYYGEDREGIAEVLEALKLIPYREQREAS